MKPLSTQNSSAIEIAEGSQPAPTAANPPFSAANRRTSPCPAPCVYPWLLFASTTIAAGFCLLYITKPVIVTSPSPSPIYSSTPATIAATPIPTITPTTIAATPIPATSLLPGQNRLPGEPAAIEASPESHHSTSAFEQTNLRIQHLLTAEAPGGHLAKIDLEVPVLYRSRSLRWTPTEVAVARELLARLTNYQEKSQLLRAEGAELLDSWNHLIENSIPTNQLRADSPSLPSNQQDAVPSPRPAGLNTAELIKIQPAVK